MTGKAVSIVNEKGGVGKTTVSVQMSFELAQQKHKTLLIDMDPSGDATETIYGEDNIPNSITKGNSPSACSNTLKLYAEESDFTPEEFSEYLHVFGATDHLSVMKGADLEPAYVFMDNIEKLKEIYDYIIIDCPPSFGLLFTASILACDGVIIPVVPEKLAYKAAKKTIGRINTMNSRFGEGQQIKIAGIIKYKVKTNPLPLQQKHFLSELEVNYPELVFETQIDERAAVADAMAYDSKLSDVSRARHPSVLQFTKLVNEVIERVGCR